MSVCLSISVCCGWPRLATWRAPTAYLSWAVAWPGRARQKGSSTGLWRRASEGFKALKSCLKASCLPICNLSRPPPHQYCPCATRSASSESDVREKLYLLLNTTRRFHIVLCNTWSPEMYFLKISQYWQKFLDFHVFHDFWQYIFFMFFLILLSRSSPLLLNPVNIYI